MPRGRKKAADGAGDIQESPETITEKPKPHVEKPAVKPIGGLMPNEIDAMAVQCSARSSFPQRR